MKTFLMDKIPNYNKLVIPYHVLRADLAAHQYGFPGKRMRVIGVTGTNGKTSTCFLIWRMLNAAGHKTGLMTTVAWGVDKLEKQIEHMTTVDAKTLNYRMKKIADAGAEFLVLEVTSHALAQHRTFGVPIEIAVMTNVTHEHLDYHKTFENYRDAKRRLFKMAKYGVINEDDKSWAYFAKDVKEYITYGINSGILRAKDVRLGAQGVDYSVDDKASEEKKHAVDDKHTRGGKHASGDMLRIKTKIPGEFTVYNSLAAVAVGLKLGLSKEQISQGILALDSVEGRMNRVDLGQNFEVIVDYAHTPDAFLKVYESVVPGKKGRIISLFGGAGRRDESTRGERGEIAAKYSDIVIITEDDSRDENPAEIAEEFAKGAEQAGFLRGKNLLVELNRAKAIQMAIDLAKKDDIVLILGKGHEKTILRATGAVPFEDLKVTREALKKRLKA
ncbi:UDP-N-acetylmuramoyl-L-alanyl-D-glutamate--2,6-diaminopimelate ligase [Candidatus Saccharibacteria bacterium]|nr:UDP-N-acetylmuramoyl-L-alanyl-D-glutamate--2,6-diaminopimelate ligase [Candidatus Saccharibacteria bacterium]